MDWNSANDVKYRQFISEFVKRDMPVYFVNSLGEYQEYTFEQVLPFAFGVVESEKYLI